MVSQAPLTILMYGWFQGSVLTLPVSFALSSLGYAADREIMMAAGSANAKQIVKTSIGMAEGKNRSLASRFLPHHPC